MGRQGRPNPTEHAISCKRCAKYRPSVRDNTRTVEVHSPRSSSRSRHNPDVCSGRGVEVSLVGCTSVTCYVDSTCTRNRTARKRMRLSQLGFFGCLVRLTPSTALG